MISEENVIGLLNWRLNGPSFAFETHLFEKKEI